MAPWAAVAASSSSSLYRKMSTILSQTGAAKISYLNSVIRSNSGNVAKGFSQARMNHTRIHRLIEEDGVVLMAGCSDALSAAIVNKVGFRASFLSGFAVSNSFLGQPDLGLLTPPEVTGITRLACAAVPKLPIIVDADTGGGGPLNVQRTVKELIAAGAAGCFIEDQAWPKRCGHMRGKQVIPAAEHAAKIAAARDAIGDADFFLVARTDARATSEEHGLSDAIARANLYKEAGADGLFVEAPRNDDELREIGRRVNGIKICNLIEGGHTPLHTPEELKAMGFHLVVHCLTTVYASVRGMIDVLTILKEKGTTRDHLHKMATFQDFNELLGLESFFKLEEKYSKYKDNIKV